MTVFEGNSKGRSSLRSINLISPPLLHLLAAIDQLDAGLLGVVTRFDILRHHAALMVLSVHHHGSWEEVSLDDALRLIPVAKDIRKLSARDLLEIYIKPVKEGLPGALKKIEPARWTPEIYRLLASIFCDPAVTQAAAVLRQLTRCTGDNVRVLAALAGERAFLTPEWISALRYPQIEDLLAALPLLRSRWPEFDDVLEMSVQQSDPHKGLGSLFGKWLRRLPEVSFPSLDLSSSIRPLNSPAKLSEAGRRYRNCLGELEKIIGLLSGQELFYECTIHGLIAHVLSFGKTQHILVDFFYEKGQCLSPEKVDVVRDAERLFREAGIPSQFHVNDGWKAIIRIAGDAFRQPGPIWSSGALSKLED